MTTTTTTTPPSQPRKSNLDLVKECDSFPYVDFEALATSDPAAAAAAAAGEDAYYAFLLPEDPRPHGYLPAHVVDAMPWTADFVVSGRDGGGDGAQPRRRRTVQLLDASRGADTAAACTASLAALVRAAQDRGVFARTLGRKAEGEDYRVMGALDYQGRGGLVRLRRSAAPLFGIANRGAHMTVYVREPDTGAYKFWIPRRSRHLATYPGMLDNTVAGGTRAEETPFECIIHESDEEASLPEAFVRAHVRAAGTITYVTRTGADAAAGGYDAGLCVPDVLYNYDLEVPAGRAADAVPRPRDDEVEQFYLWDLDTVRAAMARGEFKSNTSLVLIDFFIRHGILTEENEPDYLEIISRLHRRLPVPTAAPRPAEA